MDRLEILGADRLRFLNAYVTCEVKTLAAGEGAYGFLTSPQGRILADLVALAHGDRLWLVLPPERGRRWRSISGSTSWPTASRSGRSDDMLPLRLIGPRAAAALGAAGCRLPGEWRHVRSKVHGTEVALQRSGRLGAEAYTLWVSASIAGPWWRGCWGPGVTPVGSRRWRCCGRRRGSRASGATSAPRTSRRRPAPRRRR